MTVLIDIQGLKKDYRLGARTIHVLEHVDLQIARGEKVSIMGPSGAGKSTFLHVAGTLDMPSSGSVHYEGMDVFKFPDRKLAAFRNRTIGFVFQFHYLLPDFSALENVMMPGRIAGDSLPEIRKRARRLLEEVGLEERFEHRPGELSGGEQQRVAIARALVMEPKILLADELTGNLDASTSKGIHDLLHEINALHDTTLVVVTHNTGLADSMDRRLILQGGSIENRDRLQEDSE